MSAVGWCPDCGDSYQAAGPIDVLCPSCQRADDELYANDPTPVQDGEYQPSPWSKAGMRERLGVIWDVDE